MTVEIFRPVLGYEGIYKVSNLGRVHSLPRIDIAGRKWCGKLLKQGKQTDDRPYVTLRKDGKSRNMQIAWLVAEAWHGPRPEGLCVLHNDGDRFNNAPGNLRYGTHKENGEDMVKHGHSPKGVKQHLSKLTEADIPLIRDLLTQGLTQQAVADRFGIHQTGISAIKRGKTWTHIYS
jgi:hypothetical protein